MWFAHTRWSRRPREEPETLKQGPDFRPHLFGFVPLKALEEQTWIGSRELSCCGFPSSQILKPDGRSQLGLAQPHTRNPETGSQEPGRCRLWGKAVGSWVLSPPQTSFPSPRLSWHQRGGSLFPGGTDPPRPTPWKL